MSRPLHRKQRALLMGLITPKRLKENEQFIVRLSDRQIATFAKRGSFEVFKELSHPLATLVTTDLLGILEDQHARLLGLLPIHTSSIGGQQNATYNLLEAVDAVLSEYIVDRRSAPRGDVLTRLADARFSDGSVPDVKEVAQLGSFLFAAGQDTTVRLITASLQILGDDLALQRELRPNRDKIPRVRRGGAATGTTGEVQVPFGPGAE